VCRILQKELLLSKKNLLRRRQSALHRRLSAMLDLSNREHFCIPALVIENRKDITLALQLALVQND